MTKDNKRRRTFLEVMVDQGHSTREILKWKDCWDWQETTQEDIQEKIKEMEKIARVDASLENILKNNKKQEGEN